MADTLIHRLRREAIPGFEIHTTMLEAANKLERLELTIASLYYAAHWTPDRDVGDADMLWKAVRDAAEFEPGNAPLPIEQKDTPNV